MQPATAEILIPAEVDAVAPGFGEVAGLSPELPLALPEATTDRGFWIRCIVIAVLLHASVLAVLNWPVKDNALGGAGTELEAVSVELVKASAIETTEASKQPAGATSTARLDQQEGSERQQVAAMESPDRTPERRPEPAAKATPADLVVPEADIKPEVAPPETPAITIAPVKAERPVDVPDPPAEPTPNAKPVAAAAPSAPSEAANAEVQGGATARSVTASDAPAPAAAQAITGELGVYAREVQKAVARTPPRIPAGAGGRGEVVITFALGLDGSLISARIMTSSGNSALDDAALAAVRRARFPNPPAGSQLAQLVYKFPVRFR